MIEENRRTITKEFKEGDRYLRIDVHSEDISREEIHLIEDKFEQFCDEVKKISGF